MKKIKGRKQMISFLLSICMIITMIPLNAFASSVASASDFKYDTPEDITIYKNETEVVILMDYGYTYEMEMIIKNATWKQYQQVVTIEI